MRHSKDILNALVISFVLLRLANFAHETPLFQTLAAGILVVVLLFAVPQLHISTKLVIAMMLVVSVALLVYAGADAADWRRAILQNGNLVMLLICVPMIAMPFYYRDYQSELKALAQAKLRSLTAFLALVSGFTHFLAVSISLGAILTSYTLMRPIGASYNADHNLLKTVSRSYFSSGFWSPAWGTVIIYTIHPDVEWIRVAPVGIAFAALFNAINLLSIYIEGKRFPARFPTMTPQPDTEINRPLLYTMLALLAGMIGSIIAINLITGWELMIIVTIVAILFPLVVALLQRLGGVYRQKMRHYYDVSLVKGRETVALFGMAGFLAVALDLSGAGAAIIGLLPDWLHHNSPAMLAAIMLVIILPGGIGIHPAATGTAIAIAVQPAALGLTSYTFALGLLTGWVIGLMVAPFGAATMMLSSENGKSIFANSTALNWKFSLVCIAVFSLLISVVGPMMG